MLCRERSLLLTENSDRIFILYRNSTLLTEAENSSTSLEWSVIPLHCTAVVRNEFAESQFFRNFLLKALDTCSI